MFSTWASTDRCSSMVAPCIRKVLRKITVTSDTLVLPVLSTQWSRFLLAGIFWTRCWKPDFSSSGGTRPRRSTVTAKRLRLVQLRRYSPARPHYCQYKYIQKAAKTGFFFTPPIHSLIQLNPLRAKETSMWYVKYYILYCIVLITGLTQKWKPIDSRHKRSMSNVTCYYRKFGDAFFESWCCRHIDSDVLNGADRIY